MKGMVKIIKIYEGNYNKSEFYSLMGKYFAEPMYKRELPYLVNRENLVWFINLKNNKVAAFGSLEEKSTKIEFVTDYFEFNIKDLREVIESKFKYLKDNTKPIETAANKKTQELFKEIGFIEYKHTINYFFMRKE